MPVGEIRFFVKLKCQSSAVMLSLGIKYSVRDLICDVNYCSWGRVLRHASYTANHRVCRRSL